MRINTEKITEAIYNLCVSANTTYSQELYDIVLAKLANETKPTRKQKLLNILKNANTAYTKKRPLCQDTGQVIVFVEVGQNIKLEGQNINNAINAGVEKAYKENFFRKSTVKNALTNRENSNDNKPAIIYTDITDRDEINIKLMIKGAGSENCSSIKMFSPSATEKDIFYFIKNIIESAGEKACPPLVLGIGIGGTMDKAAVLSKKAFFCNENTDAEKLFIKNLKKSLSGLSEEILDIKLLTTATHIASLPVAITINCHSTRHAECTLKEDSIDYKNTLLEITPQIADTKKLKEVSTEDIEALKKLKAGEQILLTGEIYTARDAAHKKLNEMFGTDKQLPLDLKNKIIFYAGPCPPAKGEIIGPIGPTTSYRMDSYTELIYSNGVIATIGKGERSEEATEIIKKHNGKYFSAQGGIACLLADCIKKSELIAFEELETEAIRKLYVEKLPLTVEI